MPTPGMGRGHGGVERKAAIHLLGEPACPPGQEDVDQRYPG